MCGRYALTSAPEALRALFGYAEQPNFPPRYNIAPTQPVALVVAEPDAEGAPQRHFRLARWGFLPGFVRDVAGFPLIINARSETASIKPAFRNAMKRRRCLVPADAYYEWLRYRVDGRFARRAFLFRRRNGALMAFAGLWETFSGPDGSQIDTVCILTTAANGATAAIHDRMPAIIAPADFSAWLDCGAGAPRNVARAAALLGPAPDDALVFHEIRPAINKATNEGPDLQQPLRAGPPET
jgi:putative SOS response-associated peptidase YedK